MVVDASWYVCSVMFCALEVMVPQSEDTLEEPSVVHQLDIDPMGSISISCGCSRVCSEMRVSCSFWSRVESSFTSSLTSPSSFSILSPTLMVSVSAQTLVVESQHSVLSHVEPIHRETPKKSSSFSSLPTGLGVADFESGNELIKSKTSSV